MSVQGVTAEEVIALWDTALRADAWVTKKAYRAAQNLGMRYQNWRHKGTGENGNTSGSATPATTTSGKAGKQWNSVEETTRMTSTQTYYHHVKKEK